MERFRPLARVFSEQGGVVWLFAAAVVLILVFFAGMKIGALLSAARTGRRMKQERAEAVRRSRAVLGGQMAEKISPWLPDFPADPTEVHFLGSPVDFIAFSGAASGCVSEVLFIEVKTGASRLSPVEESLQKAVEQGRVRYTVYRPPL